MKVTEHTIHTAKLKNNCPECYSNDGLVLSFTQKEKENKWLRKVEKECPAILFCTTCKMQIFPVRWDEHIERVYQYYKKLVVPKPAGRFFKARFWIAISVGVLGFLIAIYWLGASFSING